MTFSYLFPHDSRFSFQSEICLLLISQIPFIFNFNVLNFTVTVLLYLFLCFIRLFNLMPALFLQLR